MRALQRHGFFWIIGRFGILIVFGIIPLQRSCFRVNNHAFYEHADKSREAYQNADKSPVLSSNWNYWRAIGDKECGLMEEEYKKMTNH